MNRIREIRESKGLTEAALADLVGTSQATIHRLETGERKLTEDWMRAIAKALEVTPADLISAPTLQDFREETKPYDPVGDPRLKFALTQRALAFYTIISDALELLGIKRGDVRLFDLSQQAVDGVKTGDVVLAQLYDPEELFKAVTVVRQFVAPSLLTTNRSSTNVAFTLENANFSASIKGILVDDESAGMAGSPP